MSLPDQIRDALEAASWTRCQRDVADAIRVANDNVPMSERHDWLTGQQIEAERRHFARMQSARQRWRAARATAEVEFCDRLLAEWAAP